MFQIAGSRLTFHVLPLTPYPLPLFLTSRFRENVYICYI